jgi:hypothetical protein
MTEKVKLTGGPGKTVTWVRVDHADDHLRVELYDFNETAQHIFGNDIAHIITVYEMKKLFSAVNQAEGWRL